jgi:hypothetical protein
LAQKIATIPPTTDIPPNLTTDNFGNITGKITRNPQYVVVFFKNCRFPYRISNQGSCHEHT